MSVVVSLSSKMAANPGSTGEMEAPQYRALLDGETRTRTGDTTIFSRVLYQLSYLASALEG